MQLEKGNPLKKAKTIVDRMIRREPFFIDDSVCSAFAVGQMSLQLVMTLAIEGRLFEAVSK